MPTACLRSQKFTNGQIDREAGIIRDVKVAKVNHRAQFGNGDKHKEITTSENHIEAFLSHAGNRAIPVHWTHDYLGEGKDRLHAKVGALKNIRKDDSGDLIADLHVAPTQFRDVILWNAENDPEGMMLSAVFSYGAHDPDCIPLSFEAADLVAEGAATTALFSKTQNQNDEDMKPEDFQKLLTAALASPETATALAALSKPSKDEAQLAALAAAEKEAGVTEEDGKGIDANLPASTQTNMRIQRATLRKAGEIAKTTAKAEALGAVGSADFSLTIGAAQAKDFESAVQAEFAAQPADKKDISRARFSAAQKHAKLYNNFRATGGNVPATATA